MATAASAPTRTSVAPAPALVLSDLRHAFAGRTVIDGLGLEIAPGEIVCLLGPSGCGKTTTLRIVAGLEPLQHGRIEIAGIEVASPGRETPPERRGVGMVFQDHALFPHLNVRDNIAFGLRDRAADERRQITDALLDKVDLSDFANAYPATLSGGEQQRVALARALAPDHGLLLLDEPFASLDRRLREEVRDETMALLRREGVAALFVTHDPDDALASADRIAVMRTGRLEQVGTPSQVYDQPSNVFVACFMQNSNVLSGVFRSESEFETAGLTVPVSGPAGIAGTAATVVVRQEAIRLDAEDGLPGRIEAARGGGGDVQFTVRIDAGEIVLKGRMLGPAQPGRGAAVRLGFDPRGVHVFPANP